MKTVSFDVKQDGTTEPVEVEVDGDLQSIMELVVEDSTELHRADLQYLSIEELTTLFKAAFDDAVESMGIFEEEQPEIEDDD